MEKMTNVKALAYVLENCTLPDEIKEKVENIHASYVKKSATSADRKPTERQIENANIGEAIVEWLKTQDKAYAVAELLKECPACADVPTTQRLTPIMAKLEEAGKVAKSVEKRRNYYRAV